MNRYRSKLAKFTLMALTVVCLYSESTAAIAARQNIVVFLIDDMGYMDIGAKNTNCIY